MKAAYPKLLVALALLLLGLAAAGAMTASVAQGDDPPSTASFRTVDGANVFQRQAGSGSATSADIVTGGTVTFQNASIETHNVDFDPPAQGGVSCQQVLGGSSPSALTFPLSPTAGTWSGTCTFMRAGTYSFMCDHHPGMAGTVVVSDPGAPPGTTTAPPVTTTTPVVTVPSGGSPATTTAAPAQTTGTPPPAGATPGTPADTPTAIVRALAVRVALAQRGPQVRGAISGARSAALVQIGLTARRGDLGLAGRAAAPVRVGALAARTTGTGTLAFVVRLDGKARTALARRGRLAVTVLLASRTATGAPTRKTFRVVVRPVSS